MSLSFKVSAVCILALVVMSSISYQKTGHVPGRDWLAGVQEIVDKVMHKEATKIQVSTWTDVNGVVHYENRPIEGAHIIAVDPDINVIPSSPAITLSNDKSPDVSTQELRTFEEAKKAHVEALTQ